MPSAGDIPARWNTTVTQFDDADTGPNHVWDFSVLQPQLETADTCVSVSSTPILYQFFFNNPFIYPDHDADYAVRGQDFDFQVLRLTDVYDYFKRDANGFDNVGFGANINGVPASVQRLPVDHVYELPLNYSDASTSPSTWEVEVPGVLFFRQEQVRDNTVDGWGTLYLPTDTFQVLRVKSVLNRTDSIYVISSCSASHCPSPRPSSTSGWPQEWMCPCCGEHGSRHCDHGAFLVRLHFARSQWPGSDRCVPSVPQPRRPPRPGALCCRRRSLVGGVGPQRTHGDRIAPDLRQDQRRHRCARIGQWPVHRKVVGNGPDGEIGREALIAVLRLLRWFDRVCTGAAIC